MNKGFHHLGIKARSLPGNRGSAFRRGRLAAAFLLAIGGAAPAADIDGDLSEVGRSFLEEKGWARMEQGGVIGHSDSAAALDEALSETVFMRKRLDDFLLVAEPAPVMHLFVITDGDHWREQLHSVDGRQDALAAQFGSEIYVFWDARGPANTVRLAHELAHERLRMFCSRPLPVWLEEGLAGYLGWEAARTFRQSQGSHLYEKRAPASAEKVIPFDRLTGMSAYPEDPAVVRMMYAESEELIRQIALRVGAKRLGDFLEAVCREGLPWDEALRNRFGFSTEDLVALEAEVLERIRSGQEK